LGSREWLGQDALQGFTSSSLSFFAAVPWEAKTWEGAQQAFTPNGSLHGELYVWAQIRRNPNGTHYRFAVQENIYDTQNANAAFVSNGRRLFRRSVVNVEPNYALKLRAGPGTRFNVVAAIPADATGILAFDKDGVWDGDTWWYPVEWQGLRGYVSGDYLPHPQ
jgi:hypothetical protein